MFRTITAALTHSLLVLAAITGSAADGLRVRGVIETDDGSVVPGAQVTLRSARQVIGSGRSGDDGRFTLSGITAGTYVLRVAAPGFADLNQTVRVEKDVTDLRLRLQIAPVREEVSVTADPGRVEEAGAVSQAVNVISAAQIQSRVKAVTAQAMAEEEGVHWQRTSPTISGVFVRGLTGNKVNVFVDGVRFSNAAARGGINTFLNTVEAANLQGIEILRGPNSAQYGSDALGGSVQFLTTPPTYGSDGLQVRHSFATSAGSADAGAGADYRLELGTKRFGLVASLDGRRSSTLYTGGGIDSHSAFTRFFGLPSAAFLGPRMPGTAFTQYGGMLKLFWSPRAGQQWSVFYARSQQDNGKRFDQLLGGDGNLIADLGNLKTDLFYARYDLQRAGWFDGASLTYSYNAQREERINQGGNGNPAATIVHEPERTRVHGVQGYLDKRIARQDLLLGAEYYDERLYSRAFGVNPATLAVTLRRPRIPHNAQFRNGGMYLQDVSELIPQKLRLVGSVRTSAAGYRVRSADSPLVGGLPLWRDDAVRVHDWTFRAGIVGTPAEWFSLYANVSRGFRAPHMTDLGTLGLTGSGFEVAAPDVAGLGATIGDSAAGSAVSTGRPVTQVTPESSLSYEFGAHVRHRVFRGSFTFFVNDINDNITKQALILPPGAVGLSLGGPSIIAQNPGGAVFVAATPTPVLVRANFDDARIYGFEHQGEFKLGARWSAGTVFTYLHAADARTGLAPNIEGGTPAPDGYLRLRYTGARQRWWVEPYLHAAARQERLSSLDLEDRRTGATRTRGSIQNFFRNGARARGLIGPGPDGIFGNADDVLLLTGETLLQIQDRVLGVGVNSAPLFRAIPGYATVGLRGGIRFRERHALYADLENIADHNYRGISWGLDAPGRNLTVTYRVTF
jgi:hemoglobin/transferrin/lactoferrin receptor protein